MGVILCERTTSSIFKRNVCFFQPLAPVSMTFFSYHMIIPYLVLSTFLTENYVVLLTIWRSVVSNPSTLSKQPATDIMSMGYHVSLKIYQWMSAVNVIHTISHSRFSSIAYLVLMVTFFSVLEILLGVCNKNTTSWLDIA